MMISFHLPPTAARAAVSGQSDTGFGRRARAVVTRRFLLVVKMSVDYDAPRRRATWRKSVTTNRSGVTPILLCSAALAMQPFRAIAQPSSAVAPTIVGPAAMEHDGQHD